MNHINRHMGYWYDDGPNVEHLPSETKRDGACGIDANDDMGGVSSIEHINERTRRVSHHDRDHYSYNNRIFTASDKPEPDSNANHRNNLRYVPQCTLQAAVKERRGKLDVNLVAK